MASTSKTLWRNQPQRTQRSQRNTSIPSVFAFFAFFAVDSATFSKLKALSGCAQHPVSPPPHAHHVTHSAGRVGPWTSGRQTGPQNDLYTALRPFRRRPVPLARCRKGPLEMSPGLGPWLSRRDVATVARRFSACHYPHFLRTSISAPVTDRLKPRRGGLFIAPAQPPLFFLFFSGAGLARLSDSVPPRR